MIPLAREGDDMSIFHDGSKAFAKAYHVRNAGVLCT